MALSLANSAFSVVGADNGLCDRKARKGDFRKLWIQRINAAVRAEGITYNRFIQGLHLAGIELDRRALAELAVSDPETFKAIVEQAKAALPEDVNAPVEA